MPGVRAVLRVQSTPWIAASWTNMTSLLTRLAGFRCLTAYAAMAVADKFIEAR